MKRKWCPVRLPLNKAQPWNPKNTNATHAQSLTNRLRGPSNACGCGLETTPSKSRISRCQTHSFGRVQTYKSWRSIKSRSSSREVKIRVPTFSVVCFRGTLPKKKGKRALLGDLEVGEYCYFCLSEAGPPPISTCAANSRHVWLVCSTCKVMPNCLGKGF